MAEATDYTRMGEQKPGGPAKLLIAANRRTQKCRNLLVEKDWQAANIMPIKFKQNEATHGDRTLDRNVNELTDGFGKYDNIIN
jgi:hypothetical protein